MLLRTLSLTILLFCTSIELYSQDYTIWDGPEITFTKADNANPNAAANQDSITDGVRLTRGNNKQLYNAASENGASSSSPAGTQWAEGTTEDLANLSFTTLVAANGNKMINIPGKSFVLFLEEDSIYIDVTFNSWTCCAGGGGFSYTRTTKPQSDDLPPETITLSSPSDGSTGVSLTPTLSWNEDANADSYTIQVSTDGFESFVVSESLTDTSFTTPELEYNTEYSWRVRGTNSSGDGDWSEVWTFTTQSLQSVELSIPDTTGNEGDTLVIPIITSDLGGKNLTAIDIDITHDTSMVEIVSVNRSETIFSNVVTVTNLVGNSYRIGGSSSDEINGSGVLIYINTFLKKDGTTTLELNTTLNEGEINASSTNGTITVSDIARPAEPSLTTPSDGADNIQLSPTLEWSSVSGATSYSVEITSDNFNSSQTFSTSSTLQEVGPLTYGTSYSWRVRGSNTSGDGDWSEVWTFTTQQASVSVPVILTPEQNADSVKTPTKFLWQADENATSYQAELFTDALNTKVFEQSLTDTSIIYTEMVANKDYLFRVRAVNAAGTSRWSSVEFRTAEQDVNTSMSTGAIPTDYFLNQNYPNPFNPITTIQYQIPVGSYVSLTVYNMLGQKVEVLVNEVKSVGNHQVTFDASNLSSGSYIYRLESGEYSQIRTMFLVK